MCLHFMREKFATRKERKELSDDVIIIVTITPNIIGSIQLRINRSQDVHVCLKIGNAERTKII